MESHKSLRASGSCLCQAVRFEIRGPMRDIVICHCRECRKASGHYVAATATRPEDLILSEDRGLRWFKSSELAQRGFCHLCGSTLFWKPSSGDRISVSAGSLDGTTDLRISAHIFVGEKGDYYRIDNSEGIEIHSSGGANLNIE